MDVTGVNYVVHDPAKLRGFIGLGNYAAESVILIAAHRRIHGVTAGNDRVHRRIDLDQSLQGFFAAHSTRQSQIENDEVEALARFEFLAVEIHALECALRLGNLIAEPFERELDQGANRFLIIHDENAPRAGDDLVELAWGLDRNFLMLRRRQIEGERGSVMDL